MRSALADDLRRFLDHRPIRARRPSPLQRARKWARRHRAAAALLLLAVLLGGGAGLWWARQRAGAEAEARAALREADVLGQEEKWSEALREVRRAEEVLRGLGADPGLWRQAGELGRDLEMADRLQEARLRLVGTRGATFDWEAADRAYGESFAWYGLDVDGLGPREAAGRIAASPIRLQLAAALDDWAGVRRARGADGCGRRVAVARAVDPDPWRDRLRDALEGKDARALDDLAAPEQADGLPPATAVLLGRLAALGPGAGRAAAVLRRVRLRHPDDFWVHYELGLCAAHMRPSQPEEAVRSFAAAVALRPQCAAARLNLGNALLSRGRPDEAVPEFLEALRLRPDYPEAHCDLGVALCDQGRTDDAVAEFREALRLKKDYAVAHADLGNVLALGGRPGEAAAECREALRLQEDLPEAHIGLGNALVREGRPGEAVAAFRDAVRLDGGLAEAHCGLGQALRACGRPGEAVAELREAVRLNKDLPRAHSSLGNALGDLGRLDEAVAEQREAIRLDKNLPEAHNGLGCALTVKGRLAEAVAEFHEALRLRKESAEFHYNLGNALQGQGRPEEASAEYREALRLKKDFAQAHYGLGEALRGRGRPDEAIAEYREATRIKKDFPEAHNDLGCALASAGRTGEAAAEFREAIRARKDYAPAYVNLARALVQQGQFREAAAVYRDGQKLGARSPGAPGPADQWLRNVERLAELDARLPALLRGEAQPADAPERLTLAHLCQQHKKLYAAAARWYGEAFAAQPALAENPASGHRYDAACSAVLAGCGQGRDAGGLNPEERARLRRQAFTWLKEDLRAWRESVEKGPEKARAPAVRQLQHCLEDPDWGGVRDGAALARLPEAERGEWQRLWPEVEALRRQAAGPPAKAAAPAP